MITIIKKIAEYINNNKLLCILLVLFILIKFFVVIEIGDKDFEPDGFNHVLYANTMTINFPKHLPLGLDVWAKPLYTYFFAILTFIFQNKTLFLYQFTNILIWSLICVLVYEIVKKYTHNHFVSIVAFIFTSLSFIAFRSSITALTEPIFTLTLILSFYFFQKKHWYLSAIAISLAPLARIEGFLFASILGLAFIYLLWKKEIKLNKFIFVCVILIIPTLIWNYLGYLQTKNALFVITSNYTGVQQAFYGTGRWSEYFRGFALQDIFISIFFIIGMSILIYLFFQKKFKLNLYVTLLITSCVGFFLIEVILRKFGLFGSAGLMRYFVPIIPLMSTIGAIGFANYSKLNIKINNSFSNKLFATHYKLLAFFLLIILQLGYTLGIIYANKIFNTNFQSNYPKVPEHYVQVGKYLEAKNYKCKIYSIEPAILYYAHRDYTNGTVYFVNITNEPVDEIYVISQKDTDKLNISEITQNPNWTLKLEKIIEDKKIYFKDSILDNTQCN